MSAPDPRAKDILKFWFEEIDAKQQFTSDPDFDERIRTRFGALHKEAASGALDSWMDTHEEALALVILLDQFSRNIYRGQAEAFATDAKAREIADKAVEVGHDKACPDGARAFFYMPFMHSEDLAVQDKCIALVRERLGEDSGTLPHAIWHRKVIEEFGRFPFRNKALGRETTPEEAAFLNKESVPG